MLKVHIVNDGNTKIAVCKCDNIIIYDGPSALEFTVNIGYEYDCHNIVINKSAITDDFFNLSTGIAGEITQKFVNYNYRLAIIGHFSDYSSKALHDYIYECNNGNQLYFVGSEEEAIDKLSEKTRLH